ncbi:MAG: hypothetical protein FWB83_09840, partial [Treponema sp.]|nr:hypothetical protein [Treponema sp.]
ILQMSALLFRTTSPVEIRDAVRLEIISLFLLFIPEIFNTWAQIDLAWKARGGKNGLSKIYKLVLIIISASFEKAAIKAKAVEARKGIYEK